MQPARNLVALQRAAQHATIRRDLRVAGIAASLFGFIALLAAVAVPFDPVLFAIGALLTVAGLWNLTNPHPVGILLTGLCLVVVGLFNVGAGIAEAVQGGRPSVFWQVIGAFQVFWGVRCLPRYRRFARAFDEPSTKQEQREAWAMLQELRATKSRNRPDVISFEVHGAAPAPGWALLMPEGALCLIGAGDDVRAVPRDQLTLQVMQEVRFGRAYKVRMRLADRILVATIRKDQFPRYEAWQGGQAASGAMAA